MANMLFGSFLRHPKHCSFEGEDKDEKILYVFRRSFITNFDWIFVSILLIITPFVVNSIILLASEDLRAYVSPFFIFVINVFWFIFTFGFIFQNFINWFFNLYIITNKRIIDVDFVGFLYKNTSEAPITSVEDVTSNVSGMLRVLFNYGTVYVQTAGERREFEFTDVGKPSIVRDIVSDIVTTTKSGGNVDDK